METFLFVIFASISLFFGINVIVTKKPIYSTLSMILCMVGIAGLFALLDAPFVAIMQLWVYAGGVMVFIIFVVMMLNPEEELSLKKSVIGYTGVIFSIFILVSFVFFFVRSSLPVAMEKSPEFGKIEEISKILFSKYLVPFELVSLVLLVAIIGAIWLGKKKVKKAE
jgi:NADH-quinone oxidoreductase subunit J